MTIFTFNESCLLKQLKFSSKAELIEQLENLEAEDEELEKEISNLAFKINDLVPEEERKLIEDKIDDNITLFPRYELDVKNKED